MTGVFSIAEVIDDSNKRPKKTIFCHLREGFSKEQNKSLEQVALMVKNNGGRCFNTLNDVANYLNTTLYLNKL